MKAYYKEMFRILPGLVLPVVYGVAVNKMNFVKICYPSIGLHVLIYVCIYVASMWFFAMNDYEKGLAKKAANRVLGKMKRA